MNDDRPTLTVEEACAKNAKNIVTWLLWRGIRRADVGDASQEVFQAILRSWDTFDPEKGDLQGWLYGITKNIASNYLRRERRGLRMLLSESDYEVSPSSSPENIVKQKRDSDFLWSVIEKLPADRREVVIAHLNGLTLEAISTALEIPLGTAHSRLTAAKRTIQEAFVARDRRRSRGGILPLLFPIDALFQAERARISDVPPDAVVEARAALDQTLSDLARGPASGVRDASPHEKLGSPEQQRIARLIRRLRPFLASGVLGALAVVAPWLDPAPSASPRAVPSTSTITREIAAPAAAPDFASPAERPAAQAETPRASSSSGPKQPAPGAHVGKRSAETVSSSLAREKMEAVIRAVRRGDSSASSAMGERSRDASAELGPARALLQRRAGEE